MTLFLIANAILIGSIWYFNRQRPRKIRISVSTRPPAARKIRISDPARNRVIYVTR